MARLTLREVGTVVHAEGDLADALVAAGWEDADEAEKAPRRRSSKKD